MHKKKVEQYNYSIRKRLLKYDDVLNQQREVIYGIRNDALHVEEPIEIVFEMTMDEIQERIENLDKHHGQVESSSMDNFLRWINSHFPVSLKEEDLKATKSDKWIEVIMAKVKRAYHERKLLEDNASLKQMERYVIVKPIDNHWQNHLTEMEELRRSVGLRSYGQKDPLNEYKSDAFLYFTEMMKLIRHDIAIGLFRTVGSLQRFNNMLQILSKRAKTEGPTDPLEFKLPESTSDSKKTLKHNDPKKR